jgi:hypothetical protein
MLEVANCEAWYAHPRAGEERLDCRASADITLAAHPVSVFGFERFVDSLTFVEPRTRMRIKLAGEEILDNIIRHAPPIDGKGVAIRVTRRRDSTFLGFYFHSSSFATFAARCQDFIPLFDPAHRRWRGIGLIMCRNLAGRIILRPGTMVDRIFMFFTPFMPVEDDAMLRFEEHLLVK